MLRSYFTIALRTLRRHLGHTVINGVGLAVGLACCLLALLYVRHEMSYDDHHAKADRIVRVTTHYPQDDRHWATTSTPLGPALRRAIPEITTTARFAPFSDDIVLRVQDQRSVEPDGVYADSTVFDVFTLPLVRGNPETALTAPHTVVVSEDLARRYFGDANPLGRTLQVVGWGGLTVTGVMEDVPATTHLPITFMISMATFYENEPMWAQERTWERFYTYALLQSPDAQSVVEEKLPSFTASFFARAFDEPTEAIRLDLQALTDIHLHSHLEREFRPNGDIRYVYLFGAIALFVLLIACVNFVNLATAQAAQRRGEVGMRKALGAQRRQLIVQFLGESILLSVAAFLLALGMARFALPTFNALAGTTLHLDAVLSGLPLLGVVAGVFLVGIGAGSYPAFILSHYPPVTVLREAFQGQRSSVLRKGLVVFQFAVSMFLLAGTAIVYQQLQYVQNKPLGFDQSRVAAVRLDGGTVRETVRANPATVRQELTRHPAIQQVSLASTYPGRRYKVEPVQVAGRPSAGPVEMRIAWGVDHDYLATLGVDLIEGRDFSRRAPTDTAGWILNCTAIRRLGLSDPIGKELRWRGYTAPIVGIAEDFHYASLHHAIEPLALPLRPETGGTLLVRMHAEQSAAAVRFIEEYLQGVSPNLIFRYSFLDDRYEQLYATEKRLRTAITVFAILAIVIACLGLFGLAAFTANRRTKEMGIRKVLGATASGLVLLLTRDFVKLVGLGFVVAAPLAYLVMDRWLEDFAYRIDLGLGVFLGAGVVTLIIALLTVSYQAMKAARTDPAQALRHE